MTKRAISLGAVHRAVSRKTSSAGLGFAGASGLFASGLTDIASTLGPLLMWFFVAAAILAAVLALKIGATETRLEQGMPEPTSQGYYCHLFAVLVGSLFGSGILLITGLFTGNSEGSRILALLGEINEGVARVEEKVEGVGDQVAGIGQQIKVRDISGRSGTGMIGDVSTFEISLENERLMDGASCSLSIDGQWKDRFEIIDDDCAAFRVQLMDTPLLDEAGRSLGDVMQIPYVIEVLSGDGRVLGTSKGVYPFQNQYRTISLELDPAGNRLKINERRRVKVSTPGANIPENVACEWNGSTNPVITFVSDSEDNCEGWLSTETEKDSFAYKDLISAGEKRGEVYLQLVSSGDFTMLGITEIRFSVSVN